MRRRVLDELTDREREVLGLLRRDFTNEQIAQRLGISVDGAKYHVSQILSKLGVSTREEAAAWSPEERHPLFWKLAWIGAAGALAAIVALSIALAIPSDGDNVQLESDVLARGSETSRTIPRSLVSGATPTPAEQLSSPTASPPSAPAQELDPDPEPSGEPPDDPPDEGTPPPTPEPAATPEPLDTPAPTDCACSGIEGNVVITACPVDYGPPEECYPPYQATIVVWNADRTEQVLEFTTDEQGQFRVPLSEGEYYIEAKGSQSGPDLVTVPRDRFVPLKIIYWTGIL